MEKRGVHPPLLIQCWAIVASGDEYAAPELRTQHLVGYIPNHPTKPCYPPGHPGYKEKDGKPYKVQTSRITGADGRIIRCLSRSYILGMVDPKYRRLMRKLRPDWSPKNPFV